MSAAVSQLLGVVAAVIPFYVIISKMNVEKIATFIMCTAWLPVVFKAMPGWVSKAGHASFMLPVVPLLISLSFNVPIDVFHVLTEPFLREIAGQNTAVDAKQWGQLSAQLATLFFVMIPVYFVMKTTHAVVYDTFEEVFSSTSMTNTKKLYLSVLPERRVLSQAAVIITVHILTVLFPASFAFNRSNTRYERGLALAGWVYSGLQTAFTIYTLTSMKDVTTAINRSIDSNKKIAVAVALGSAILTSLQESIDTTPMSAMRHSVAYFLGSGTVLCLIELVSFVILTCWASVSQPSSYSKKSTLNWIIYICYTGTAAVLMVLSNTTKKEPLVSVAISTFIAVFLVVVVPKKKEMIKGNTRYHINPVMRFLITASFVAPFWYHEGSVSAKIGMSAVVAASQLLFNDSVLPGMGCAVVCRTDEERKRAHQGERGLRALDTFLNTLRYPFVFAYVAVLCLAVFTVIQEGYATWGLTQGYFEQEAFTDIFTDPLEAPLHRNPQCSGGAKQDPPSEVDCYQLCNARWAGLDIMDLSYAASMAYINVTDGDSVMHVLNNAASRDAGTDGEPDWVVRHNNHKTDDWVAFLDIYSASRNVSVIAVRGSSPRFMDWLEDMSLFGEMTIFSLLSGLVPGLLYWPPGFFQSFLSAYTSIVGGLFGDGMKFFTPVVAYAEQTLKDQPREVVFVGHSLGGAVAKIAGALVDRQAVGISSPGIMDSRKKFVHNKNYVRSYSVRKLVTNVYSQGDYVPAVGRLGGSVHELYCSEGAQCHSLPITLCELYAKCPNGASGRQFVGSKRAMKC
eukprot:TRINITY_DN19272_c0_g1_i1.p1 TRINITY_DN19272_c0_g1~~TRINITY_DN19272_c0_g1_i1.p1  ORF type:complete len:807 (+),score=177.40 TRINITY_DN19272_c0_g1_i1:45-2423(+)